MAQVNSNSPENARPVLKVIPPQAVNSSPSAIEKPITKPQISLAWRWVMMGGLLASLGGISLLYIPNSVRGDITVMSTPDSRYSVRMQIPGTVNKVLVEPHQSVKAGEPVAEIKSDELETEIADVELRLKEANVALAATQEKIEPLRADLNMMQIVERSTQKIFEQLQQEVNQLTSDNPPPRIRVLKKEIEGLAEEQKSLEVNLKLLSDNIHRLDAVAQAGGVAQMELNRLLMDKNNWERMQKEKANQIKVKQEQIDVISLEMQKNLEQASSEWEQAKAATQKTIQQIQETTVEVQSRQQVVTQLQTDLARVKYKQKYLTLRTEKSGIITTEKLDQLQNQHLNMGESILEVVDVQQLTAHVKIAQEDKPLVELGDRVVLYPRNPEMEPYHAKVEKIDSVVKTDETGKPWVTVYITVKNPNLELKPGETGYAQIQVNQMPIYQKVARELRKLFPRGKWQL